MEVLNSTVSRNLTYYMSLRGYNKTDLARAIGVSNTTAGHWCSGKKMPRSDKASAIASWLGITLNELVSDHPETRTPRQLLWDEYGQLFEAFAALQPSDRDIIIKLIHRMGENE